MSDHVVGMTGVDGAARGRHPHVLDPALGAAVVRSWPGAAADDPAYAGRIRTAETSRTIGAVIERRIRSG